MEKYLLNEYTVRITQASPTELVVITYELILAEIKIAKEYYNDGKKKKFESSLKCAQQFLAHMINSLDYRFTISYDLLRLYLYINKKIVSAICKLDPNALMNSESIIEKLMVGFQEICKEDKRGPVMINTQQLYAGITYSNGKLNEYSMDINDEKRGYRV